MVYSDGRFNTAPENNNDYFQTNAKLNDLQNTKLKI